MTRGKRKAKRSRPEDTSTCTSTADLSSTVGDSIKEYFDNLILTLKTDFDSKLNDFEEKLENKLKVVKEELISREHDFHVTVERLERELVDEKKTNEKLREECREVRGLIQTVHRNQGGGAQYLRRNNIKIYGLRETGSRGETVPDTIHNVIEFLNVKMGVRVSWEDICIAHRLGRLEQNRYRSVIVKFVRRTTKLEILENRYKLKGSGIVLAEDLTPENNKLFWELREHMGKRNVWTRDCQIYVNTREGPRQATLETRRELLDLASHEPHDRSTPIQRYQHSRPAPRGYSQHATHVPHQTDPARPGVTDLPTARFRLGRGRAASPRGQHTFHAPRQADPVRPGQADPSTAPFRFGRGRAVSPRGRGRGRGFPQPPPPGIDDTPPGARGPPLRGFARGRFDDA